MRALTPMRKYINETNELLLNSDNDFPHAWFIMDPAHMDIEFIENVISTAGQESGATLSDVNVSHRVERAVTRYMFRNTTNHTCMIRFYECVARRDSMDDVSDNVQVSAFRQLIDGWNNVTAANQVQSGDAGTVVKWDIGDDIAYSTSYLLDPFKSDAFCQNWLIAKTRSGRLASGDEYTHDIRGPGYDYFYQEVVPSIEDKLRIVGGVTKILLLCITGSQGKFTDNSGAGFTDSAVSVFTTQIASTFRREIRDRNLAIATSLASTTMKTVEAPQMITSVASEGG